MEDRFQVHEFFQLTCVVWEVLELPGGAGPLDVSQYSGHPESKGRGPDWMASTREAQDLDNPTIREGVSKKEGFLE